MWWWIALAVLLLVFFVWASRRTRGRGTRESGGRNDQQMPYPPSGGS
jgi:hypothetical protein